MHRHLLTAIGTLAVLGLLAGCGRSTKSLDPSASTTTGTGVSAAAAAIATAQVNDQIAVNSQLIDEDAYQSSSISVALPDGPGGYALIHPLRWFRQIKSVDRSVSTDLQQPDSLGRPTVAIVTVHKELKGVLHIFASDSAVTDSMRIAKTIDDNWTRKLVLHRVWIDSTGTKAHWHIVGTSGVKVATVGGTTHIQSVRVQAGAVDTLITDPLALYRLRRTLHVPEDTHVTVTVTTDHADDDVFFYHSFDRHRFHSNGDGTFTTMFTTGDFPGLHHFGVDALSRGTLHDDAAAYSSNAWVFPFAAREHDCDVEGEDHHE